MEGYQCRGEGENEWEDIGNEKHNRKAQNIQGKVKDSIVNGETKECVYI